MLAEHQPVKRLLAKIREMLVDSNYEEKWRYSTYENGVLINPSSSPNSFLNEFIKCRQLFLKKRGREVGCFVPKSPIYG